MRKLNVPSLLDAVVGALGEDGFLVIDRDVARSYAVTDDELARAVEQERAELARQVRLYRLGAPRLDLEGKTVILVDDALESGVTAQAACDVARARGAERIVVAVPVASVAGAARMDRVADRVLSIVRVDGRVEVGEWYENCERVTDNQVINALLHARRAEVVVAGGARRSS